MAEGRKLTMRTLMLVDPGLRRPPVDELRRLIDADRHPDVLALEDALGATLLDEHYLAAVGGRWGMVLRRLPSPLNAVIEAFRRRHDYDVLVTWAERLAFPLAALLWIRRARTPHLAILFWVSKPKKAVPLRLLHRGMARVLLPTDAQRRFARDRLGLPGDRLPDICWGTDLRFWRPFDVPTDTICSVGREMRDYVTLVDALRGTGIPCHIAAGTVRDVANPWLDRLDAAAARPAGVTVCKLPFEELRALYARSRFVVVPLMPSDNGNGQTAIGEALAMGRPVICSRIEGLAGVFDGLEAVRFVEPGDADGLRAAVTDWWAQPEECDRLGAIGRHWVERAHPQDAWVNAMADQACAALDEAQARRPGRSYVYRWAQLVRLLQLVRRTGRLLTDPLPTDRRSSGSNGADRWSVGRSGGLSGPVPGGQPIAAQRHPGHGVAVGRLVPDLVGGGGAFGHRVGEPPQAVDLDLDHVARLHRARVGRRSGEHDVAGQEGHVAAEVGQQVVDGEVHLGQRTLLHDLAVAQRPQRRAADVHAGHQARPQRAEAVLALDPQHRAGVGLPEVLLADVVGAGEAGQVVPHVVGADVAHRPPDHGRHLALVVEVAAALAAGTASPRWLLRAVVGFWK